MKFLATVVCGEEAEALGALADLVDVKNPAKGPLGAPSVATALQVRGALREGFPLSVALGDLDPRNPGSIVELARLMAGAGATMLKVGLASVGREVAVQTLAEIKRSVPAGTLVGAAAYADGAAHGYFPAYALPSAAREAGIDGIMLDTFSKGDGKSLLDHMALEEIMAVTEGAKKLGLLTALAGKLDERHILPLSLMAPDWIGFRTAITRGGDRGAQGVDLARAERIKIRIALAVKWAAAQPVAALV